jgi:hypothetical protein
MMGAMRLPFVYLAWLFLACSSAFAAGPSWPLADMPRFWVLGEGYTHASLDGFFFYTKENYDQNGQASAPASLEPARYANLRAHLAYGLSSRASLFGQMDMRGVFLENAADSSQINTQSYGLGDAFLAARWLLFRSGTPDRVNPAQWSPGTWIGLAEASWLLPLYDSAKNGAPTLGDRSNDFTLMGRLAWFANDWLGLAANAGYTYRTSQYSPLLPWGLRADFNFLGNSKVRFWAELQSEEGLGKSGNILNPSQPDPLSGGSLLFKSQSPTLRTVTIGAGYRLGREWELAGGLLFTAAGVNSAKGTGGALGLAWRPYQMAELSYESYRKEEMRQLGEQSFLRSRRPIRGYGLRATILNVSSRGNFFRIAYGQKDGVQKGDAFQVFAPDEFGGKVRRPVASAVVEVSRENDSFLRVDQRYGLAVKVQPGYEVRRVIFGN